MKLTVADIARVKLRNPGKEPTVHDWTWNPTLLKFDFPAGGKVEEYVGAVECTRCGLRCPISQQQYDSGYWRNLMRRLQTLPEDGSCDENIVAKVLEC